MHDHSTMSLTIDPNSHQARVERGLNLMWGSDMALKASQEKSSAVPDLIDRVDHIAEDKMIPRGAWIRNAILKCVREEEERRREVGQTVF